MSKPSILVARAIFPETSARLAQHFEVTANQTDDLWDRATLIDKLRGKASASSMASASLRDHLPMLRS